MDKLDWYGGSRATGDEDSGNVAAAFKSETARLNAADLGDLPLDVVKVLARNESAEVRRAIACRQDADAGTLRSCLEAGETPGLRLAVAGNPNTAKDMLRYLVDSATDPAEARLLASREDLPDSAWQHLALWRTGAVRGELFANAAVPAELLVPLWDDDDAARTAIAGNRKSTQEVLLALAADESFDVRETAQATCADQEIKIPWSPACLERDPTLAPRLAESPSAVIREAVALWPETSTDVLAVLAQDPSSYVAYAVAGNRNTSEGALIALGRYGDATAREIVARHPRAPQTLLEELADDPIGYVRLAAEARVTALPDPWDRTALRTGGVASAVNKPASGIGSAVGPII